MKNRIFSILLAITIALVGAFCTTVNGVTAAGGDDSLPAVIYELTINESSGLSESDFEVEIIYKESSPCKNDSDTLTVGAVFKVGTQPLAWFSQTVWWEWDYTYVLAWDRYSTCQVTTVGPYEVRYYYESDNHEYNYGTYLDCMSKGSFEIWDNIDDEWVGTWEPLVRLGYVADGSYWGLAQ